MIGIKFKNDGKDDFIFSFESSFLIEHFSIKTLFVLCHLLLIMSVKYI